MISVLVVLALFLSAINAFLITIHDFPQIVKPETSIHFLLCFKNTGEQKELLISDLDNIRVKFDDGHSSPAILLRNAPFSSASIRGVPYQAIRKIRDVKKYGVHYVYFYTKLPNLAPDEYSISLIVPEPHETRGSHHLDVISKQHNYPGETIACSGNYMFTGECELRIADIHNKAIRNMHDGQLLQLVHRYFKLAREIEKLRKEAKRTILSSALTLSFALLAPSIPRYNAIAMNIQRAEEAMTQIMLWIKNEISVEFADNIGKITENGDYKELMDFCYSRGLNIRFLKARMTMFGVKEYNEPEARVEDSHAVHYDDDESSDDGDEGYEIMDDYDESNDDE